MNYIKKFLIIILLLHSVSWLIAQVPQIPTVDIYVSKQSGQSSIYNGNFSKQTDKFEQGTVTFSTTGPLSYQVDNAMQISPNQNKTWNGSIQADVASSPTPGNTVPGQLTGTYDLKYSRPYGTGTSGTVESTYYCSNNGSAGGTSGCKYHNGQPGAHEMVHNTGAQSISFNINSILVDIPDTICLGKTGQNDITAQSYPAAGGTYEWTSGSAFVVITNGNTQTANIKLLDTTIKNATVKVKFTIQGISYEKTGILSTCECNCKAITNGISAGPLQLNFNVNPTSTSPDGNGNCLYNSNNASFNLTLNGGAIQRTVNIQNNASVTFGKNCQAGTMTQVGVDWTGSIVVPELEIKGIKVFTLTVKELHLIVATNGNMSGSVKVNVANTVDRDLSLGKKVVMLRKGTNSDVTFTFNNTNGFAGTFNWSGIQGIIIDLCKQNAGQEVKLANFTGNMNAAGTLTGNFTLIGQPSYKSNLFKVTVKELTLGLELGIPTADFRLTSGSGKVGISEMKTVTGSVDLGLNFPAAGGCTATVDAANMTAFTMTLDDLHLQADFNRDFDITKIQGSLKAKHNQFDAKIDVSDFKVDSGSLTAFSCSGQVKYSAFKFTLTNATFGAGPPGQLSISARVEIAATGTAAMIQVTGFTIKDDGSITVGSISGNLNRAPATIAFSATFGNNKFTGTFNGEFAGIGMDGAVDVGKQSNPDYCFAYLSITAKVNVPLGQSGLKLTQIGGKVGYNYQLTATDPNVDNWTGNPMQGNYLVGLKLGVADIGNMCEVVGQTLIQFGNGNVTITLGGSVAVLKNNKFFEGNGNVTYVIPAQTITGALGMNLKIPSSGWVFSSNNLNINFFFGNNTFTASGTNMGGTMFGGKVTLSNGGFNLDGNLSSLSSLTGSLTGTAACSFSYNVGVSAAGNSIGGTIWLNMNSNINASFNQNGLNGSFSVHVDGGGRVVFDSWIYSTSLQSTASCDGNVAVNNGGVQMSGNITLTLPFSIPFWGNQVSTGNVSVSL